MGRAVSESASEVEAPLSLQTAGSDPVRLSLEPSAVPSPHDVSHETWRVIEASSGWAPVRLGDLWRYRELLYFLAWRDVKVRYKQTVLGAFWAVLKPALTVAVFSVVFGHFARIPSQGVPYPIFAFAALLPWNFFAATVLQSSGSMVGNSNLISKVYFPRLVIPISTSLATLLDLAIAFLVLLGMMVFYHIKPSAALLALPAFLVLALAAALAVGIWFAALSVRYRDVAHVVPFLTQVWLYATPIVYPASLIRGKLGLILGLNPMTAVVEGFRWALLGTGPLDMFALTASIVVVMLTLISGLFYFRRVESEFADVV